MQNFFKTLSRHSLGTTLTRVLVSVLIIKDLIIYLLNTTSLFNPNSLMPEQFFRKLMVSYHLNFLAHLFQNSGSTLVFLTSSLLIAIFLLLGIYTRLSGILLFFAIWLLRSRNLFLMDGADNVT